MLKNKNKKVQTRWMNDNSPPWNKKQHVQMEKKKHGTYSSYF